MEFQKKCATIYKDDDGRHRLMLPGGLEVPGVICTWIKNSEDGTTIAEINLVVNMVPSKSAALRGYGVKTPQK